MSETVGPPVETRPDGSTELGHYLERGVQILQLDSAAVREISRDEDALLPALLFFAVAGVASGAGQLSFRGMFFGPILATLLSFVVVGLLSVITRLLGGSAGFLELYRPLGVAAPILWVQAVPLIGPLLGGFALLYCAVVATVTVEIAGELPRSKSVASVALLAGVTIFLCLVFLAIAGSLFLIRALLS